MAQDAGNTRRRARRIQLSATATTLRDSLNRNDKDDFFRFVVATRSSFDGQVSGIPRRANFDFQLQRANGSIVTTSRKPGRQVEDINTTLEAGVYFARVFWRKGRGQYNLQLSLKPDNAGESFGAARSLGTISDAVSFQDYVGASDGADFYALNLSDRRTLNVTLDQLGAGANVTLFQANQSGIVTAVGSSASPATLQQALNPGTYFLSVTPQPGANTTYNLTLSTTALPDQGGQDFATAIPFTLGFGTPASVSEFVGGGDAADFYTFTAPIPGNLTINLTDLAATADLDITLYDSTQAPLSIQGAAGPGGSEQIVISDLQPGQYFIGVTPVGGSTSGYTLSASLEPQDNVGDATADATLITTPGTPPFPVLGITPNTYTDFAGGGDQDVFKLVFTEPQNFLSVKLQNLTANLDVQLTLEGSTEPPLISSNGSTLDEFFEGTLSAGTYYLTVYGAEPNAASLYDLVMSVDPSALRPTITRDVNPTGDARANNLTDVNGVLFFSGEDGTVGAPVGLWKTQGTLTTTAKLGAFTSISEMVNLNGTLYLSGDTTASGSELWKWDSSGGPLGTLSLVTDLAPGSGSSSPSQLTAANGNLYFIASPLGGLDFTLYRANAAGVTAIASAGDLPQSLVYVSASDTLYYTAGVQGTSGSVLFKIAGAGSATPQAPAALTEFGTPETNPRFVGDLKVIGGDLFFVSSTQAATSNYELRRIDSAGNLIAYDANQDSVGGSVDPFAQLEVAVVQDSSSVSYAYFQAEKDNGKELFRVNLSSGAIEELSQINSLGDAGISNLAVYDGKLYFTANDGTNGTELWFTDPNGTTVSSIDLFPGLDTLGTPNSGSPSALTAAAGKLYFAANGVDGRELYSLDNTGLVELVVDVAPAAASSNPEDLIVIGDLSGVGLGGKLYFTAEDGTRGRELWTA